MVGVFDRLQCLDESDLGVWCAHCGRVAFNGSVLQADVDRVHVETLCEFVDQRFDGECGLGGGGSAVGC